MEEFKKFVRSMPKLKDAVTNNQLTWQKVYEIYDLYGENDDFWLPYQTEPLTSIKIEDKNEEIKKQPVENTANSNNETTKSTSDNIDWVSLLEYAKKIDVDKLTSGIDSLQKVLGIVSSLVSDDSSKKQPKKARQVFQKFND